MTDARRKISTNPDGSAAPRTRKAPRKDDIRAFLADNPHYLTDNPEVLAALVPGRRHDGESVVDLQGFLIDRLRQENTRLDTRYGDLLAAVRGTSSAQARIHGAVLSLLEARSFRELIEVTTTDVAIKLDVDIVTLAVENRRGVAERSISGIRLIAPGEVDRLMGGDNDIVLKPRTKGRKRLYDGGAGLVASEALMRLHASPEAPPGILALASRVPDRFDPGQGTELLGFLARVLELCIRTWLGLPRS